MVAHSRFVGCWLSFTDIYEDGLIEALSIIGPSFPARPVLFLTHDFQVKRVVASRRLLDHLYLMALPGPSATGVCLSKETFTRSVQSIGVPLAKEFIVHGRDEVQAIFEKTHGGRWVVKPVQKDDEFEKVFGKAIYLDTSAKKTMFASKLAPIDAPLVIQEWIPGTDADVFFCLSHRSVMTDRKVDFVGRKIRQFVPRVGNTASAKPFYDEQVLSLTDKIFAKIGLVGMGSVVFKRDPISGNYFAIEPTVGRTDLQSELAVINGCNFPAIQYYDLLGDQASLTRLMKRADEIRAQRVWIRGWADAMSAFHYWQKGELTLWDWACSYRLRLTFAVWRCSDPKPFFSLAFKYLESRIKSTLRSLLGDKGVNFVKAARSHFHRSAETMGATNQSGDA